MEKFRRLGVSVSLFLMVLLVLSGCSTANYGRLESDKEIKHSFETYQVLPNHKYYYWGVSSSPAAIVGIEENYELNLTLWVKIDTESDNYRRFIDIISTSAAGSTAEPWGFRILDKTGNYVGVWYSAVRATSVEINDNRQIVMFGSANVVRGEDHK